MTATLTIMYPTRNGASLQAPDTTFDWEYYTKKHMPYVAEVFDKRLKDYNVTIPQHNVWDGEKFHAIATLFFDDIEDFDGTDIFKCRTDIINFTNSNYEIILGESI